jgi:hypothetical protein
MSALGYILWVAGILLGLAGSVMFLGVAYQRNLWWFFGCLFVPLVTLLFFCLNLKATLKPVGLQVLGLLLAVLGGYLAGGGGLPPPVP